MAATTSAVSMAMKPLTSAGQKKAAIGSEAFLRPLPVRHSRSVSAAAVRSSSGVEVRASLKEKAAAGLSAGLITASVLVPQVAEAADGGLSPSLKNFLLSIVAGGVVLTAIIGVVVGVSNFDPVKRA